MDGCGAPAISTAPQEPKRHDDPTPRNCELSCKRDVLFSNMEIRQKVCNLLRQGEQLH